MADSVRIDLDTAKRIAKAVREWERGKGKRDVVAQPSTYRYQSDRRLAVITASDGTTNKYSYSVLSVQSSSSFSPDSDLGSGDYTAADGYAICEDGCTDVLYNSIVHVKAAPCNGLPFVTFEYDGGLIQAAVSNFDSGTLLGTATFGSQTINFKSLSAATISAGTSVYLCYAAGQQGGDKGHWCLDSIACSS